MTPEYSVFLLVRSALKIFRLGASETYFRRAWENEVLIDVWTRVGHPHSSSASSSSSRSFTSGLRAAFTHLRDFLPSVGMRPTAAMMESLQQALDRHPRTSFVPKFKSNKHEQLLSVEEIVQIEQQLQNWRSEAATPIVL